MLITTGPCQVFVNKISLMRPGLFFRWYYFYSNFHCIEIHVSTQTKVNWITGTTRFLPGFCIFRILCNINSAIVQVKLGTKLKTFTDSYKVSNVFNLSSTPQVPARFVSRKNLNMSQLIDIMNFSINYISFWLKELCLVNAILFLVREHLRVLPGFCLLITLFRNMASRMKFKFH